MLPISGRGLAGGQSGGAAANGRGTGLGLGMGLGLGSSSSSTSAAAAANASHGMKAMRLRGKRLWQYVRRLGRIGQMDFEVAVWQIVWLVIAPKRVYRSVSYHKQTKNQWARDDPAFLLLTFFALALAAVGYSIAFGASVLHTIRLIFTFIFLDFVLPGLVVATLSWAFANKFLRVQSVHSVEQSVEWAYAFDIHCNSFVPVFVILYLLQFFFLPIVLKDNFFAAFLGNTMYLVAAMFYSYITFLGYNALPFLHRTVVFLYPNLFFFIFYVVALFTGNFSKQVLGLYFPL